MNVQLSIFRSIGVEPIPPGPLHKSPSKWEGHLSKELRPEGRSIQSLSNKLSCFMSWLWYWIYLLITSVVTLSPTVRTKYPSLQSSPPQRCLFNSGNSLNIVRELAPFRIFTIFAGEYLGGAERKICTWSHITSMVSISNSYCSDISWKISLSLLA